MLEIGSGCIQHDVMKCYVTGRGSVMSCNVLGEATVTRISTLSGRGKRRRGGLEDLQNITTHKNLNSYSLRILSATCENDQPKNSKIQSLYYSAIQMVFGWYCIHGI